MDGRIRDEKAQGALPSDLLYVREWQVNQAGLCKALMDSLAEQVDTHRDKMGARDVELSTLSEYEQAEGASSRQVKEDVKRLRRELLLLAKSYGWSYGH